MCVARFLRILVWVKHGPREGKHELCMPEAGQGSSGRCIKLHLLRLVPRSFVAADEMVEHVAVSHMPYPKQPK